MANLPRNNIKGVLGSVVDAISPQNVFPYRTSVSRTVNAGAFGVSVITVPAGNPWLCHVYGSSDEVTYGIYKTPTFTGGTDSSIYHADLSKEGLPTGTLLRDVTVTAGDEGTLKFVGSKEFTVMFEAGSVYLIKMTNPTSGNVTILTDVSIRT
jgi:hypothetical protein